MPETEAPPPFLPPNIDLRDYRNAYVRVSSVRDGRLSFVRNDGAFKAGFCLMLWSWHQLPAASLPDDDHALARLADVSLRKWRGMKSEALVEFVLCADGRWYHRDLAERALSAWAKKQSYKRKMIRRIELESEEWSALRLNVFRKLARRTQTEGARLAREAKRLREHAAIKAEVERLSGASSFDATPSVTDFVTDIVTNDATSSKREGQGQGQGQGDNTSLRSDAGEGRSIVDRFMDAYPVDVAPDGVERELRRRIGEGVDPEDIIAGAARYAKTVAGKPPDKIANPVTWIRDGRWKDGTRKSTHTVVASNKTFVRNTDERWGRLSDRYRSVHGKKPPEVDGGWYFLNAWIAELQASAA